MESILLDTNISIAIFNGSFDFSFLENYQICLCAATVLELYALSGMSKEEEKKIDLALLQVKILPLERNIAKRAGLLARTRTNRRHRIDLIIAATALEYKIPLVTKNIKNFKGIKGLKVMDRI